MPLSNSGGCGYALTAMDDVASADINFSVVIPTYNGLDLLRRCLPSVRDALARANVLPRTEIIVADDASTDGTAQWLGQHYPDVIVVHSDTNRGFAANANAGISRARGQWVALVNNDVIVDPEWFTAASRHFDDPAVAAVASRIVSLDPPGQLEEAGDEYTIVGVPYKCGRYGADDTIASPRVCFSGCGASVFYRAQALEEVGLFHEPLGAYYEDVELGFRLNLRGWDCLYEGNSLAHHAGSATYGWGSPRQKFNASRNAEIVFYTCMPRWLLARYLPSHLIAMGLQTFLHAARGHAGPYLKGKAAAFGQLGQIRQRRRHVQAMRTAAVGDLAKKLKRRWIRLLVLPNLRRLRPAGR